MSLPTVVQFSTRREGVLAFWDRCVEQPNVYTCPVERFLRTLSAQYAVPMAERQLGLADSGECSLGAPPEREGCEPWAVAPLRLAISGSPSQAQSDSES